MTSSCSMFQSHQYFSHLCILKCVCDFLSNGNLRKSYDWNAGEITYGGLQFRLAERDSKKDLAGRILKVKQMKTTISNKIFKKWLNRFYDIHFIVMIDSITKLCLSLLVCTNGLSYLGEETRPTLCIKATPNQSGVRDHKRNKHQLLHRIQSVWTFTNLQ